MMRMTKRPAAAAVAVAIDLGQRFGSSGSWKNPHPTSTLLLSSSRPMNRSGGSVRQHHHHQHQQRQQRWFSSSDIPQRQGRERFYVHVGVEPCAPPWIADNKKGTKNSTTSGSSTVASPISAGVDGTDSASGVVRRQFTDKKSSEKDQKKKDEELLLLQMLRPRAPAKSLANFFQDDDAANNTTEQNDHDGDWHAVTLDGRTLRTPLGHILALPSRELAWAVAVEWNAVHRAIQPNQMPLMTICCTALDQVVRQPEFYREQCLRYLQTDTVCYWADPVEERLLHQKQQRAWKRLHHWMVHEFCHGHVPGQITEQQSGNNNTNTNIVSLFQRKTLIPGGDISESSSSIGLPHSPALTAACARWVDSLDGWHLAALHAACLEAKSWFVAAALVTQHPGQDVRDAHAAGRVEEEYQIAAWGLVEGQHDYDRLNATVQLSAAALVVNLTTPITVTTRT